MVRLGPLLIVSLVTVGACSGSGPAGLGKKACPYLRARLVRLDRAVLTMPTDRSDALANITAVDQDIRLYVASNLPSGGKLKSDQPLVRFSAALDRFAAVAGAGTGGLDPAEESIKHECDVATG